MTRSSPVRPSDRPDSAWRRPGARRRGAARALVVVAALLVSGCGLRLETPAPTVPAAGPVESARAAAVADARAVRSLADAARTGTDAAVAAVLARTADDAAAHTTALGGVYVSGLDGPTTAATPTTPTTPAQHGTREVVDLLRSAADRSRAAAVAVPDGALARLLASITVSRLQDARALVAAAGLPTGGTTETVTPATGVPSGASLPGAVVTPIVLVEDQAGFAEEVAAAWLDGTTRATVLARAEMHRERAQAWAVQASIDSTPRDPRRVAYDLPADPHDASTAGALVTTVETALASAYLTAVASSGPTTATAAVPTTSGTVAAPSGPVATSGALQTQSAGSAAAGRAELLMFADDAWATASTWGAAPSALPGLASGAPVG